MFHPRLCPEVFQQEGWHHDIVSDGAAIEGTSAVDGALSPALRYKGVVYNEMKGVYSSPDSLHAIAVQEALFPDNVYKHSSGGDPAAIPVRPLNPGASRCDPCYRSCSFR